MNVLSFNLGSSSLKYAVHSATGETLEQLEGDTVSVPPNPCAAAAAAQRVIDQLMRRVVPIDVVGHRVVFGGDDDAPSPVTAALFQRLERLSMLDPLHAPGSLAVIRQACAALEKATHVACFDTAFFRDLPQTAKALPIPSEGDPLLRRFGFHGLSYECAVSRLAGELRPRTIVAHLGSGCSVVALADGRPVDVTMGFSPLSGVIMASRPGDLDPGVLLYLLERGRYDVVGLRTMLEEESGLRALSNGEADVRLLSERTDERAVFAIEMFVRSIAKAIGSLTVTLGGLDMLVFTGGIGEHNLSVRDRIRERTRCLNPDVEVRVVAADENTVIARHAMSVAARYKVDRR